MACKLPCARLLRFLTLRSLSGHTSYIELQLPTSPGPTVIIRSVCSTTVVFRKDKTPLWKRSLKEELKKPEELESDDENEMKSDPKNLKPIVDDGTPRDFRVQDISMDSLRVDKLIRKLFTVTGKECDSLMSAAKVRVNNKRITLKSLQMREGDILDMFLNVNADNEKFTDVSRIEFYSVSIDTNTTKFNARLKRWKRVTIADWESEEQ